MRSLPAFWTALWQLTPSVTAMAGEHLGGAVVHPGTSLDVHHRVAALPTTGHAGGSPAPIEEQPLLSALRRTVSSASPSSRLKMLVLPARSSARMSTTATGGRPVAGGPPPFPLPIAMERGVVFVLLSCGGEGRGDEGIHALASVRYPHALTPWKEPLLQRQGDVRPRSAVERLHVRGGAAQRPGAFASCPHQSATSRAW